MGAQISAHRHDIPTASVVLAAHDDPGRTERLAQRHRRCQTAETATVAIRTGSLSRIMAHKAVLAVALAFNRYDCLAGARVPEPCRLRDTAGIPGAAQQTIQQAAGRRI